MGVLGVVSAAALAAFGCSGDADESESIDSAERGVDQDVSVEEVPAPGCDSLVAEVCRLNGVLRDACSPDNLGSDCSGVAVCNCAEVCFGASASATEPCFSECKANRCECIHDRWNYPRFVQAKRAARDAGCDLMGCGDPCAAL